MIKKTKSAPAKAAKKTAAAAKPAVAKSTKKAAPATSKKVAVKPTSKANAAKSAVPSSSKKVAAPAVAKTSSKKAVQATGSGRRIGIFGGSFNPFHNGHLSSLREVIKLAKLDLIYVVPSNQNPLKVLTDGPSGEERLQMVKLGVQGFEDKLHVDEQEVKRGGVTYTIDTLNNYRKKFGADELFLIVGADLLESLPRWKNFPELIELTNFVVTTRPGFHLPTDRTEIPAAIRNYVDKVKGKVAELSSGRSMQFVTLKDVDASATAVRRRLRSGLSVQELVPKAVAQYISETELFQGPGHIVDYREFTNDCAQFLFDRKAVNLKGYDLRKMNGITDYTLIASGTSTRHVSSMAETLVQKIKEFTGVRPLSVEGTGEGRWVVVDYGSLIIHIFYDFVRQEFRLEELWRNGTDLKLMDQTVTVADQKSDASSNSDSFQK